MKLFSSLTGWRVAVSLVGVTALAGMIQTAPAAEKPTIPIIVKDTTSAFWQIVLAGARKSGQDLNVNVPELGAQSESDINGPISILKNAVSDKFAGGVATPGWNIMTALIAANPNLRGVFASNLIMAQGAGQAIAENKAADKIKLIGFDSDDKLIGFLKDGTIAALVVQDPYRMGYDGVKTALAASKGEQVPANVDTGANLITKENMDQPRQHELLFPKVK